MFIILLASIIMGGIIAGIYYYEKRKSMEEALYEEALDHMTARQYIDITRKYGSIGSREIIIKAYKNRLETRQG